MRQGTGYAYGAGEDWISYKCEGCGRRVRVTPAQAEHFRGSVTVCSRDCVARAHAFRRQQQGSQTQDMSVAAANTNPPRLPGF